MTKTDNASLEMKIELRKWLLKRMNLTSVSILETCTGTGDVWDAMAAHVEITRWIKCDVKPRRAGTLNIDMVESVQRFPLDLFNVIDIDPYGEPWEPYRIVCDKITGPTAIFLTHGHVAQSGVVGTTLREMGIPKGWNVPLTPEFSAYAAKWSVAHTWKQASVIDAAQMSLPHVDYYAFHIAPLDD